MIRTGRWKCRNASTDDFTNVYEELQRFAAIFPKLISSTQVSQGRPLDDTIDFLPAVNVWPSFRRESIRGF